MKKLLIIALATSSLSACAIQKMNDMEVYSKNAYSQHLAVRYRDFSIKQKEKYNLRFSNRIAEKALRASKGINVDPEQPEEWPVRKSVIETLRQARREVLDVVSGSVVAQRSKEAADAVFLYDCWVAQEAAWRDGYDETCRNEFQLVMQSLRGMSVGSGNYGTAMPRSMQQNAGAYLTPRVAVAPLEEPASAPANTAPFAKGSSEAVRRDSANVKPLGKGDYVVYFGFDEATLNADGSKTVKSLAKGLSAKDYAVTVGGHTDTVGTPEYNLKLSRERADSVRKQMVNSGLEKSKIDVYGYGESDPAVSTADNVREAKNRRVEIQVK